MLKKRRYSLTNYDGRGILVLLDNQCFESFKLRRIVVRFTNDKNPLICRKYEDLTGNAVS